uniref:Uncharacterized protein n=1 Tax=Phaeomonas parva TaxID=124430 RepID=A0A7S1XP17_9STRA|mmetsp:Transcript_21703/g.66443  ORF Transcript_21703/g.66443 Transcript_21703/m.66443 type:complete len:153 (+) Transcript_21703:550-1008(+)
MAVSLPPGAKVITPDWRLALSTAGAGLLNLQVGFWPVALVHFAVAGLFAVQTQRVRFLLDEDSFEVVLNAGEGEVEKGGENIVVGGENRWKYSTFTNWKFFPSESVPILVYFKETQTKPDGQIHFFPVLCNGQELLETMVAKDIPRLPEEEA